MVELGVNNYGVFIAITNKYTKCFTYDLVRFTKKKHEIFCCSSIYRNKQCLPGPGL